MKTKCTWLASASHSLRLPSLTLLLLLDAEVASASVILPPVKSGQGGKLFENSKGSLGQTPRRIVSSLLLPAEIPRGDLVDMWSHPMGAGLGQTRLTPVASQEAIITCMLVFL
jgi:hypothetical protein